MRLLGGALRAQASLTSRTPARRLFSDTRQGCGELRLRGARWLFRLSRISSGLRRARGAWRMGIGVQAWLAKGTRRWSNDPFAGAPPVSSRPWYVNAVPSGVLIRCSLTRSSEGPSSASEMAKGVATPTAASKRKKPMSTALRLMVIWIMARFPWRPWMTRVYPRGDGRVFTRSGGAHTSDLR